MELKEYIEKIEPSFTKHFKIEEQKALCGQVLDFYAECHMVLGRTLLSRKIIIDKYETNEYIVLKHYKYITEEELGEFVEYLKSLCESYIKTNEYHRSSYIRGVIVSDQSTDQCVINKIQKHKYEKIFKHYFEGFCEVDIIYIDLSKGIGTFSKGIKWLKKVYLPAPFKLIS